MPAWAQWVTFGASCCGALFAGLTLLMNFVRGRNPVNVRGFTKAGEDGVTRLRVEVVNAGNKTITIDKVFLTRIRPGKPKAFQLFTFRQNLLPVEVAPGKATTFAIANEALKPALMRRYFRLRVDLQSGQRIFGRCTGLRDLAAQMKIAATEEVAKL